MSTTAKTNVNARAILIAMRRMRRATNANATTKMTITIATTVELKKYSVTAFGSSREYSS